MLTPFLRSDTQGAVLAVTMLDPTVELSTSEVAGRTRLPTTPPANVL